MPRSIHRAVLARCHAADFCTLMGCLHGGLEQFCDVEINHDSTEALHKSFCDVASYLPVAAKHTKYYQLKTRMLYTDAKTQIKK